MAEETNTATEAFVEERSVRISDGDAPILLTVDDEGGVTFTQDDASIQISEATARELMVQLANLLDA